MRMITTLVVYLILFLSPVVARAASGSAENVVFPPNAFAVGTDAASITLPLDVSEPLAGR